MIEGDVDFDFQQPSRNADGAGDAQDRLVTQILGPEHYDARELLVHSESAAALAVMAMIRRPAEECRAVDSQVWTPPEEETGWDSVTMGLSHDDGLGSSVFQFTRVGSAVHLHRRRLLTRPSRTPFG